MMQFDIINWLKVNGWSVSLSKSNRSLFYDTVNEKWIVHRGYGKKSLKQTLYSGDDFNEAIKTLED